MFTDIRNYIQSNKDSAPVFALFAQEGANTQNHVVKIVSPLSAVPVDKNKKIKYIPVREEHGYPQNDVMTILLAEAVKPDGNIKDAMKVIRASYSQFALELVHDDMVADAGFTSKMPDVFYDLIVPRITNSKLDYLPDGLANVVRYTESGVDLNGYFLINEGKTITEYFGVDVKNLDYLGLAKKEVLEKLRSENRTLNQALEQMRKEHPKYQNLDVFLVGQAFAEYRKDPKRFEADLENRTQQFKLKSKIKKAVERSKSFKMPKAKTKSSGAAGSLGFELKKR